MIVQKLLKIYENVKFSISQIFRFKLLGHQMHERRENTAAVTIDSAHFKQCNF